MELKAIISVTQNYANYRNKVKSHQKPKTTSLYVGVPCKDIYAMEESMSSFAIREVETEWVGPHGRKGRPRTGGGGKQRLELIVFQKIEAMATIVDEVREAQNRSSYDFRDKAELRPALSHLETLDEQELWELSMLLERREPSKDKKLATTSHNPSKGKDSTTKSEGTTGTAAKTTQEKKPRVVQKQKPRPRAASVGDLIVGTFDNKPRLHMHVNNQLPLRVRSKSLTNCVK